MATIGLLPEFLMLILLFMTILNCIKESFKLYVSITKKIKFTTTKGELFILGLSISYILALIFI